MSRTLGLSSSCKRGHPISRLKIRKTGHRVCLDCKAEKDAVYYSEHREKAAEYGAARYAAKKDQILAYEKAKRDADREKYRQQGRDSYRRHCEDRKRKVREYHHKNRDILLSKMKYRTRDHRLKSYGLTEESFAALLENQDNKCAICKSVNPRGKLGWHIDHDHKTGQVRGILCGPCNTGIGMLQDSLAVVRAAAQYLQNAEENRQTYIEDDQQVA